MRRWQIAALGLATAAAGSLYALDNGLYVGSAFYVSGTPCCPESDVVLKRCKYLFVTGVSEIPAGNGTRIVPGAKKRNDGLSTGGWVDVPKPMPEDLGFCRVFGSGQNSIGLLTR